MSEIIKIEKLTKDYGNEKGIFGVSLSIDKGEIVGLVGVNGSGKTTIMRHIMGFLKQDEGNVTIMGKDCWTDAYELKCHLGYVPGEIAFPDVKTGTSFLKIQAELMGLKDFTYAENLIKKLKIDISAPLKRMSKGMKQKMALVAAFMSNRDILLLDEPTTGLDPLMRDTVIELILDAKRKGKTVFVSSHIFQELEQTCDRIIFIKNGHIIDVADMKTITGQEAEKEYKIEFSNTDDYNKFCSLNFKILRTQKEYNQVTIRIFDKNIKKLFRELSEMNIKFISHKPYTLEDYFNKKFGTLEEKYNEKIN